jgi:hypothetical protein
LLFFLSDSIGLPQARFPCKLQKKTGGEGKGTCHTKLRMTEQSETKSKAGAQKIRFPFPSPWQKIWPSLLSSDSWFLINSWIWILCIVHSPTVHSLSYFFTFQMKTNFKMSQVFTLFFLYVFFYVFFRYKSIPSHKNKTPRGHMTKNCFLSSWNRCCTSSTTSFQLFVSSCPHYFATLDRIVWVVLLDYLSLIE